MSRRSLLRLLLLLLLCLAVPCDGKAIAGDEVTFVPADAEAVQVEPEPRISLSSVNMIPIYTVGADLRAMQEMAALFKKCLPEQEFSDIELFDMIGGDETFSGQRSEAKFRFNGYLTIPRVSYYGDAVCSLPDGFDVEEEFENDSDFTQRDEGVYESDGMTFVVTDTSYGLTFGDDLQYSNQDATRLRRLMEETSETSMSHVCYIKSEPYKIGRSGMKPSLLAVRSVLQTQAQRHDNESDLDYLARATYQQTLVSLLDAFFNETRSVEYALDFDKDKPLVTATITIDAVKGTSLDKFISRIGSQRNRVLSYLHPDQRGFVASSIPLSEDLASNLPRILGLYASAVAAEGDDATKPMPGVEQALRQIADEKSVECLMQALPGSDDSLVYIMIIPLQDASSLQAPLIQLVSAVDQSNGTVSATLGSLGQWPVHNLNLGLGSDVNHSFVVTTDDCIALCFATEKDFPVLTAVLERDFDETDAAKRFQRSVFAAATTHSSFKDFGEQVFGDSISDLKMPDDESPLADGHLELSLQTAPHQLTITTSFQNDAIGDGITIVSGTLELLVGVLESLYE